MPRASIASRHRSRPSPPMRRTASGPASSIRSATSYNNRPAEYLVSCNPQAWGAGAAFHLMQTALGIVPDTTAGRVYLNPIPFGQARSVEIRGMRVGNGKLSFKVSYNGGRPHVDVIEKPDDLAVILDEPPVIT